MQAVNNNFVYGDLYTYSDLLAHLGVGFTTHIPLGSPSQNYFIFYALDGDKQFVGNGLNQDLFSAEFSFEQIQTKFSLTNNTMRRVIDIDKLSDYLLHHLQKVDDLANCRVVLKDLGMSLLYPAKQSPSYNYVLEFEPKIVVPIESLQTSSHKLLNQMNYLAYLEIPQKILLDNFYKQQNDRNPASILQVSWDGLNGDTLGNSFGLDQQVDKEQREIHHRQIMALSSRD